MASIRTKRSIVQWVSGNTVIPTDRRFLVGIPDWSQFFVIRSVLLECANNGFRVPMTEKHYFSSDYVTIVLNSERLD